MGIKTHILSILNNLRPLTMSMPTLLAELRITAGYCGENELRFALQDLEDAKLIGCTRDSLTGDSYFKITQAGVKRLKGGLA